MNVWLLFGVQIVLITISASGQIPTTLNSESGVNISWFGFWLLFSLINLHLCLAGWRKERTVSLLTQSLVHGTWALVAAANIVVSLVYNKYKLDLLIIVLVSVVCVVTYCVAKYQFNVGLEDAIVKGVFSILCRVIPQLTLAYYMFSLGASGVSPHIIATGHCTILIRLWNLRNDLHDRNAKASFIADIANEISWIIATGVWIYIKLS